MSSRSVRLFLNGLLASLSCCSVAFAQGQDILIGQVSSQTHPVTAANAKGLYAGINVYFDHTNARGGVGGRKIKLLNKDDQLVPGKMTELTKEFIANKEVLALTGYQNTAGIAELAKLNIAGEAGIAMIAPLQGDKYIVSAPNFFPFRSGYSSEVTTLIKEAVFTQKKRVVVVYQTFTFGPAMKEHAQEVSKQLGLKVASYVKVDPTTPDKIEAAIKETSQATIKEEPDAVLVLVGGRYAYEFVKQMKNSTLARAQLYLMSIVPADDVIKSAGAEKTRGVVIAQSVPYPFSVKLPVAGEYQKLMKQYAPNEPLSFSSLEGFIAGKITVEALKRAGPVPTRASVLRALNSMGELDLGGVYVNYSAKGRAGWNQIDLTIIGEGGKLLR